ncbi:glycan biosynthesis hexose transferase WsfD [Effusibacillus pohliae]|uniref:glycan biosynthesis hexose transferase WsfD n=1 Tax=Effusibacillus pohliae TaxID=232270 RepID=UPI00037ACDB3|nr:hypothetical protein [Effusibacillus pohliae]
MKRLFGYLDLLVFLAMLLVLVSQLLLPPIIGLANNGDFERIMSWGGLQYTTDDPQQKYFNYVNREFAVGDSKLGSYVSTEILFLQIALWVNRLWMSPTTFDIRSLGFVHTISFLAAILLIVTGFRRQGVAGRGWIALLLGFGFVDVGYFAYFNSFFSESSSLIFLLAMIGFALHLLPDRAPAGRPDYRILNGFFLTALCLVLAKVQNGLLGLLLPLFGWRLAQLHGEKKWKRTIALWSAFIFVVSVVMSSLNPYDRINTYQTVFYGILKDSPTPLADLRELGLPGQYAALAGTHYFTPNKPIDITSESFQNGFYDRMNRSKVVKFYLTHPVRFLHKLDVVAHNSLNLEFYLGTYEKSANKGPLAVSHQFSQWTWTLKHVIPKSVWLFIGYFLLFVALLWRQHRRAGKPNGKLLAEFWLMLALMAAMQFVTPLLGDGEADLGKHLFLFNVLFSVIVVVTLVWLGQALQKWAASRTERRRNHPV